MSQNRVRNNDSLEEVIVDTPPKLDYTRTQSKRRKCSDETLESRSEYRPTQIRHEPEIYEEEEEAGREVAVSKNVFTSSKQSNNILFLINESKNFTFLRHETTQELLYAKWRYIPRFVYYFNLILFLLFLIFYTIQGLGYIQDEFNNYGLVFHSSIVCTILLVYFICLEFLHIKDLKYTNWQSFEHLIELINFIMCFLVLYLSNTDYKSCILSFTGVVTYAIFVSRLDKFSRIGIFVKVFGNIIKTSTGVIIIILIMLIGYTLSVTVRSRYYEYIKDANQTQYTPLGINGIVYGLNEIVNFEFSFENNIFTMITYMGGQFVSTGMGVDELNWSTLTMFLIYGSFCFVMTMLFYNIFIGIATFEIRKILQNSKIEITSTKIEYIYKQECRFRGLKIYKWLDGMLKSIERKFLSRIYLMTKKSRITLKKSRSKEREENAEEKQQERMEKLDEKCERLLIELKQISSLMQNKFDFMEKISKNKNFKSNNMATSSVPVASTKWTTVRSRLGSIKQQSLYDQ